MFLFYFLYPRGENFQETQCKVVTYAMWMRDAKLCWRNLWICGQNSWGCIPRTSSLMLSLHPHPRFYTFCHVVLFLLFIEIIFALSLAAHHYVTPATASLNVTSHLWLRPVLLIAWQLKCEGSEWEDKYKSVQAGRLSQTKARSSPSLSSLSSPLTSKVKKTENKKEANFAMFIFLNHIQFGQHEAMTLDAFLFAGMHAHY